MTSTDHRREQRKAPPLRMRRDPRAIASTRFELHARRIGVTLKFHSGQMTIGAKLVSEFDREMAKTRKILECVPDEQLEWRPHERSSTLGKLANHLAAMPIFAVAVVNGMAKRSHDAGSNSALLEAFDQNIAASREVLGDANDEHLTATVPQLNMTRADVLRERMMSHMIHHRGQLTVYLRLLNAAVPGMYGPSADEK